MRSVLSQSKREGLNLDESDTVDMMLKIVNQANRTRYDTYTRTHVPIFDDVMDLRMFLLEHYAEELSSPADANSFRLGYIVGKNQRLTVSSNSNLDEIYSSAKNGRIVLWAEPNIRTKGKPKESTSSRLRKWSHSATLLNGSDEGIDVHIIVSKKYT